MRDRSRRVRERGRTCLPRFGIAAAAIVLVAAQRAWADQPLTETAAFTGHVAHLAIGNTLIGPGPCDVIASSSATLSALPTSPPSPGQIKAAYLYWGASGAVDPTVTFDGTTVTATRVSTHIEGANTWFQATADVTSLVQAKGNGAYTFSGLAVDIAASYCGVIAVVGGWALEVVYSDAALPTATVKVFDGLQMLWGLSATSDVTYTVNGLSVSSGPSGKLTFLAYAGEADFPGFGQNEAVYFNGGAPLSNALNPVDNAYNGTISTFGVGQSNTLKIDLDTLDVSSHLSPGMTSAPVRFATQLDWVLIGGFALTVTGALPSADLAITKNDGVTAYVPGGTVTYTIVASNVGPTAVTGATVTDALPSTITAASWTCTGAGGGVCPASGNGSINAAVTLPVGGSATFRVTATTSSSATGSLVNTATIAAPAGISDTLASNNSVTDTDAQVLTFVSGSVFEDVNGDGSLNDGVGVGGARVRLYGDANGDGVMDTSDPFIAETTTAATGAYSFPLTAVSSGSHYLVAVDSKTVAPAGASPYNVGFGPADVWAEQTYGDDPTTAALDLGPRFGGLQPAVSDAVNAASTLPANNRYEHLARVDATSGSVSGVDFGFSFRAIVNTVDRDDDPASNRTAQGSLRQAIQNANAIVGAPALSIPAGTYTLAITGASEDASRTGDLDVTDALRLVGAGAKSTIIDGNGIDRVFDLRADTTMSGLSIVRGAATLVDGGGISVSSAATVHVADCAVTGNTARDGGGIFNSNGSVTLTGTTIATNQASSDGGGVYNAGTMSAANVTVSGNNAVAQGGGIDGKSNSLTLTNVTIAANTAPTGAGLRREGGATTVKNTIVSGNTGGNCAGTIVSTGNNLDGGATCAFSGPGDLSNVNPLLGPLQDNGGPTPSHAIGALSPAVDTASNSGCPAVDQRGQARPFDGDGDGIAICDIGAYESQVATGNISGTVFEDVNGDGGLGDAVGASGARVRLYADLDNDGTVSSGDMFIAAGSTDAGGRYELAFDKAVTGKKYLVVVDSKSVAPSAGFNAGFGQGDVWAEQTYGDDPATPALDLGPRFGGRTAGTSDAFNVTNAAPGANTYEHVARVDASAGVVSGVNFAFSFLAITHVADRDDDPTANRTSQGSLRQAIQNANAIAGSPALSVPAGTYTLAISGANEDAARRGDLDVTDGLRLLGADARTTIIDANGIDRVLHVFATFSASGVTIRRGNPGPDADGGGLYNDSGAATQLIDVAVDGNSAKNGGGIFNKGTTLTLDRVTLSGNTARGTGGGLSSQGGSSLNTLMNVTISGNSASGAGGGLSSERGTLTNVTITNNVSAGNGSGLDHSGGGSGPSFRNTIIAGNTGGAQCNHSVVSGGNNLASDGSCSLTAAGDKPNTAPGIGPLQYNGGPTRPPSLLAGSAAIDAGTATGAPAVDQRGIPRPFDGDGNGTAVVDIGAFELNAVAAPVIDLSLTKTVSNAAPAAGSTIVFTVTVSNAAGRSNATGVAVTDKLPAGYAYVSDNAASNGTAYNPATGVWSVGALAPGSSKALGITARVLPTGPYLNAAEVTAAVELDADSTPGDGTGDDYATATTAPTPVIDLSLTKAASATSPSVGATVVFTVTLSNAAGFSGATGVAVTDKLPSGFAYVSDDAASTGTSYAPATGLWNAGTLPSGASKALKITATVLPSGIYQNVAEVTAAAEPDVDSTPGDGTGDDFATVTLTTVALIDLSLTKAVDNATPPVGSNVVFTVTASNAAGFSNASGVAVTDKLPAGYTYLSDDATASGTTYDPVTGIWSLGGIAAGASRTLKISARVLAAGPYLNQAEVTRAAQPDVDSVPGDGTGDDFATAATAPVARIDLYVAKGVNILAPPVGSKVVFSVKVGNESGLSDANGVAVRDKLPSGLTYVSDDAATTGTSYDAATGVWTVGNLPSGTSKVLKITATVLPTGVYLNAAEVTAAAETDIDSTPGDGRGDDYASISASPLARIDLSLTKTLDATFPSVGSTVTFTMTVSNEAGLNTATGVVVTDKLPAGYSYLADNAGSTGTSYDPASGAWTVGALASGARKSLRISAAVRATGPYLNAAEVTAANEPDVDSVPGDGTGDDYATASASPGAAIDLSLAKTVDNPTPAVGSNVVFTLTLSNAPGLSNATGVAVRDQLPAGYSFISDDAASSGTTFNPATGIWTVGALASGAAKVLQFTVRVLPVGPYLNAAEVSAAGEPDIDSAPNTGAGDDFGTATTTPTAAIDLSLTKVADNASPLIGRNVVFTVTVSNAAGFSGATGVVVRDRLPAGYAYVSDDAGSTGTTYSAGTGAWNVGALASGNSKSLKITARVLPAGPYVNAAEVTAAAQPDADSTPGDGTGDDFAMATISPVAAIDLSLTKTVDVVTPPIGTNVVFTVTASNATGVSGASGVAVTDKLPAGYAYVADDATTTGTTYNAATGIWNVGALAAGASKALKITARVLAAGPYLNAAEVTAAGQPDLDSTPGDGTGDDYATATVAPAARIDLSLTKSVNVPTPAVGADVVFALTVSNAAGLSDATGVAVTDLLPAGYAYVADDAASTGTAYAAGTGVWTVGALASGASKALNLTARVLATGSYVNVAEVTAAGQTDVDSTPGDGRGDDYATAGVAPSARIDLSLVKTVDDASPFVGANVVFTLTLSNAAGWSNATGVAVTDRLPAGYAFVSSDAATTGTTYDAATGVWNAGALASGASKALKITARVLPAGPYINVAEVTAANQADVDSIPGDGTGDDHSVTDTTPVAAIDLSLTKSVNNATPGVGSTVAFTITVSNASGLSGASGVAVTDKLPNGYTFVASDATSTGTNYDAATGIWTVGALASGSIKSLTLSARVAPSGQYTNAAEVTAAVEHDLDSTPGDGTGDDFATAATAPVAAIDLSLSKTVNISNPVIGTTVVFTVTVSNAAGQSDATGVAVTDKLPAGFAYVSDGASSIGTIYDAAGGLWTVGSLPAGASKALTITARVLAAGPYANAAEVAAASQPDVDSTPGNGIGHGEDDEAVCTAAPVGTTATISISSPTRPGDGILVTVDDADRNTNSSSVDSVTCTVVNDATGESETITATETGAATGEFTATLPTVYGAAAGLNGDGTLVTRAGDTATASYVDQIDATGGTATRRATGRIVGGVDGKVFITARSVPGDALALRVEDADLNVDPAVSETTQVTVTDLATGETEVVSLVETAPSSGVFAAGLRSVPGTGGTNNDGVLETKPGDTLEVRYQDARAATGGTAVVTATGVVATDGIHLTKTASSDRLTVGEVVAFTVTARNDLTIPLTGVTLSDAIPAGFKYMAGSARLTRAGIDGILGTPDDVTVTATVTGDRPIAIGPLDFATGESLRVTYVLAAGSGALQGIHINTVTPLLSGAIAGNAATASVMLVSNPVLDECTIIGKVFDDANGNGRQDDGEDGVAGAVVALDDGTYAVTDEHGRYHLPALKPGQRMLKLDRASLAAGAKVPRPVSIVWLTPGLMATVDFAVSSPRESTTIGREGRFGRSIGAETGFAPIEVTGNSETLSVLVNGVQIPLTTGDARLELDTLVPILQLAGDRLNRSVDFSFEIQNSAKIAHWELVVQDKKQQPVHRLQGDGAPPPKISWDGKAKDGTIAIRGGVYEYYLEVVWDDGARSRGPVRYFGVNRVQVISMQLTGEAFRSGGDELSAKAREILTSAAETIRKFPNEKIIIEGHTDAVGDDAYNLDLSRRRAQSALSYLVDNEKIPAERFELRAVGKQRPIASNAIEEGRRLNRRIEIRGDFEKVDESDIVEAYQAPPYVKVNGVVATEGPAHAVRHNVDAAGLERLEIEAADSQGRIARATVPLPSLAIAAPRDASVVPLSGPASCGLLGSTEPGNSVELDGAPLAVDPNGAFTTDLKLNPGNNRFNLLVRNTAGLRRTATLSVEVSDRDASGRPLTIDAGTPRLTVTLPPDGAKLAGRTLVVRGSTDPRNAVAVNGAPVEVASDGSFSSTVQLPSGASRVAVGVTDPAGASGGVERQVTVPKDELFLLAFADGKAGLLQAHGATQAAGIEPGNEVVTEGRVAVYLRGRIAGKYLIKAALDTGKGSEEYMFRDLSVDENARLIRNLDPDKLYPVYGDGGSVVYDAESLGKFYLAVDSDEIHAAIGNYQVALDDTELAAYRRTLYGGRFAYVSKAHAKDGDANTHVIAFVNEEKNTHVRDEVRANGGSLYYLSQRDVVEGSEHVSLIVRDKVTGLTLTTELQQQGVDYLVKYPEGRVMFLRPLASTREGGSLVERDGIGGHPVFIQADYETRAGVKGNTGYGARVRQRIGRHVSVGGTYVKDRLDGVDYQLEGVDAEARFRDHTRIVAEAAKSSGSDALVFLSDDGGVNYVAVPAAPGREGNAWKLAAEIDIGEWFGKPDRWRVNAYYKQLDPQFFANGSTSQQGTRKVGVGASLALTAKDTIVVRYDLEDRLGTIAAGAPQKVATATAQWHRGWRNWGLAAEFSDQEQQGAGGEKLQHSAVLVGRAWWKPLAALTTHLDRQQTLSGSAMDRTTVGVTYQPLPWLALDLTGATGTAGHAAQLGAVLTRGGSEIYIQRRIADDGAKGTATTVLGTRSPLGPSSKAYAEYQWEEAPGGGRLVSLVGLQRQWAPQKGLRLLLSGETADTSAATAGGRRTAVNFGVSFARPDLITVTSQNTVRFDRQTGDQRQVVSTTQADYKVNSDLSALARYRFSKTEDRVNGATDAEFNERTIGLAYRPIAHERFNGLFRYTHLLDMRPSGGSGSESKSWDVVSVDTAYRFFSRFEWLAKLALTSSKQRSDLIDTPAGKMRLAIQRLNVNVWKAIDLGVEYRILQSLRTDDRRQGWLLETSWRVHDNVRLGLGYNFTDFSDDLVRQNDYKVTGWFLRLQGTY